jgi:hypothetical protein
LPVKKKESGGDGFAFADFCGGSIRAKDAAGEHGLHGSPVGVALLDGGEEIDPIASLGLASFVTVLLLMGFTLP